MKKKVCLKYRTNSLQVARNFVRAIYHDERLHVAQSDCSNDRRSANRAVEAKQSTKVTNITIHMRQEFFRQYVHLADRKQKCYGCAFRYEKKKKNTEAAIENV
jgi:hypothetical protein